MKWKKGMKTIERKDESWKKLKIIPNNKAKDNHVKK